MELAPSAPNSAALRAAFPVTFVVGTGRSGSTALSRVLRLHPEVLSVNELLASLSEPSRGLPREPVAGPEFWRILAEPNQGFDTLIRSGIPLPEFLYDSARGRYSAEDSGIPALSLMVLPHLTSEPDRLLEELASEVSGWPRRPVGEQYAALFASLAARYGGRVAVERSGYSLRWVPELLRAFPGARFVHLHRQGPDCALSMSRHRGYRLITLLREILARSGVPDFDALTPRHVAELPPDLAPLLDDRFDPALVMERRLPVTRFGALWSELIVEGVALLAEVPAERRTTLSYEELLAAPERELARLAEFVGVRSPPEWLTAGAALLDGSRRGGADRLPPDELAALRESCAPGARALAESAGGAGAAGARRQPTT